MNLVHALHANKISALQFLRGGRVRVTVREPTFPEELLSNDFVYEGRKIPVTPAGVHTVTVYVRDLPVELSDDSIKSAFSSFGEVFSISQAHFKDFPELRNGNRLLLMSVSNPIPLSFNVLGFVCQPVHCTICKESGHLPRACPLSGLCRRCKKPGHVARQCGQAGGQPRPLSSAPVPVDPVPVDPVPVTGSEDDGTCPLSPRTILILLLLIQFLFLFRPICPFLLMMFPVDLVLSILNVFRPSQLPFRSVRLKFLCFQGPNLCPFVSEYCFV